MQRAAGVLGRQVRGGDVRADDQLGDHRAEVVADQAAEGERRLLAAIDRVDGGGGGVGEAVANDADFPLAERLGQSEAVDEVIAQQALAGAVVSGAEGLPAETVTATDDGTGAGGVPRDVIQEIAGEVPAVGVIGDRNIWWKVVVLNSGSKPVVPVIGR